MKTKLAGITMALGLSAGAFAGCAEQPYEEQQGIYEEDQQVLEETPNQEQGQQGQASEQMFQ